MKINESPLFWTRDLYQSMEQQRWLCRQYDKTKRQVRLVDSSPTKEQKLDKRAKARQAASMQARRHKGTGVQAYMCTSINSCVSLNTAMPGIVFLMA